MSKQFSTPEEHDEALEQFLAGFAKAAEACDRDFVSNKSNAELVPEGERLCPICGEKMQTSLEFGVRIDLCPPHGMWLDQLELGAILEAYKRSSVQQTRLRCYYEAGRDDERHQMF